MKQLIIGLCGRKRVGKDTIANHLADTYGFTQTSFAAPIKEGLAVMLKDYSYILPDIFERVDLKEVPIPGLGQGKITARHLMVTLGTEWGRDLVADDIWTKALLNRLGRMYMGPRGLTVVVSDVRFRNEALALLGRGAVLWHVTRPGFGDDNTHRSEQERLDDLCIKHIENEGTVQDLRTRVDSLMAELHVTRKTPN